MNRMKEPKTILKMREICKLHNLNFDYFYDTWDDGWDFTFDAPPAMYWGSSDATVSCISGVKSLHTVFAHFKSELKEGFFEDKERYLSESGYSEKECEELKNVKMFESYDATQMHIIEKEMGESE